MASYGTRNLFSFVIELWLENVERRQALSDFSNAFCFTLVHRSMFSFSEEEFIVN